jgi:pimeloyl-ACP methyl ester carboxylesterase
MKADLKNALLPETLQHSTYNLEDHWLTLDGARMRFLRAGTGPNLVLLHGLLGYSFSWRYAIPVLAQQATVHAVDMLGAGFSDRPGHLDYSLRANAERFLRFLDAVAVLSCDLVGTSYGGTVAMMAAALAPERFRRLILVAPVDPWSGHGNRMAALLSSDPVSTVFLHIAPALHFTHHFLLRRLYGDKRRVRPGTLEGYSAPFRLPGAFECNLAILRSWRQGLAELEGLLPRIAHLPVLFIRGSVDKTVNLESAARLRRHFHHSQEIVLDGVGHLPYEEKPEEFNRAISDFLRKPVPMTNPEV